MKNDNYMVQQVSFLFDFIICYLYHIVYVVDYWGIGMILLSMVIPGHASVLRKMVDDGSWKERVNIKDDAIMRLLKGLLIHDKNKRMDLNEIKKILKID